MKARDRRFREFVNDYFTEFSVVGDSADRTGPPDFEELAAKYGIDWDGWRSLNKDFEVSECVWRQIVSAKRREAGRKGAKVAGRGRPKKKKKAT